MAGTEVLGQTLQGLGLVGPPSAAGVVRQRVSAAVAVDGGDRFVALVGAHRLGGLVHRLLEEAGSLDLLAPGQGGQLRGARLRNRLLNGERLAWLAPVEREWQQAGLRHLRLKGAALLGELYADAGDRYMSDIDVLLHPEDVAAAVEIAGRHAFRVHDATELEPGTSAWRRTYHVQMVRDAGDARIAELLELHWDLTQPDSLLRGMRLDVPGIVARRRGNAATDEDTLLLLAVHLARHYFRGLRWVVDIGRLVTLRAATLRWSIVLDRAREARVACLLWVALRAVGSMFPQAAAPAAVLTALRPDPLRAAVLDAFVHWRRLLDPRQGPRPVKLLLPDAPTRCLSNAVWATRALVTGAHP